jgi:ankyrin repeat protein
VSQDFFQLIQRGDAAAVGAALENDPSLAQYRDAQGVSALLWAVYTGQRKVSLLLAAKLATLGIPLDVFEAASTGDEARLQAILGEKASAVEEFSSDGWTALHLAAAFGTPLSVGALIFRGARVDAISQNAQQNQPLHAALALGKNPSTIELLVSHGADVNATQAGGFTPIFSAAAANRIDLAEMLMEHGANPHHASDQGKTPADFAREHGHAELAAWFDSLPA